MIRAKITIKGTVQGVGFRYSVRREAQSLEIKGHARNNPDGSVEVLAEGPEKSIEKLIEFCRKGPSFARVESIDIEYEQPENSFAEFRIQ